MLDSLNEGFEMLIERKVTLKLKNGDDIKSIISKLREYENKNASIVKYFSYSHIDYTMDITISYQDKATEEEKKEEIKSINTSLEALKEREEELLSRLEEASK